MEGLSLEKHSVQTGHVEELKEAISEATGGPSEARDWRFWERD